VFREAKRILILTLIALGIFNLAPLSAFRGIDSYLCRSLASTFGNNPGLLRYEDLERLGDCVAYYKTIYTVLKRSESEISDMMKIQPK
jgi:hypothetical protein